MNIDIVAVGLAQSRSIAQQGEPSQVTGVAPTWLHRAVPEACSWTSPRTVELSSGRH